MFTFTITSTTLPNPAPIVARAFNGIEREVGGPIVRQMKHTLSRNKGGVPASRLAEFNAYVQSVDVRTSAHGVSTIGGQNEQTANDLEFGENGMPYTPHIRPIMNVLNANLARVGKRRVEQMARDFARGAITTERKV